jgi:hypothetical protein
MCLVFSSAPEPTYKELVAVATGSLLGRSTGARLKLLDTAGFAAGAWASLGAVTSIRAGGGLL